MRKEIENIYNNLNNLADDLKDLPEKKASEDSLWEYMNTHNIVADEDIKLDIDELLSECERQNERQGFIFGFEYAVRLLTCCGKEKNRTLVRRKSKK